MRRDLHPSEQRLDLAARNAGFGIWDLDVRNERVHYSPGWKAMLGYDETDEPDNTATWRDRVHPDDLAPMLARLNDHLQDSTPSYEMEFRLRAADGRYRWVLSRGRVVERDAQGEALRAIGTLIDLTDWREAERRRTERMHHDATSRARDDFARCMHHELHTPLNAILGFAQLLAPRIGSADTETQRHYLAHIEQAGWQLLQMIDEVLAVSSGGGMLGSGPDLNLPDPPST